MKVSAEADTCQSGNFGGWKSWGNYKLVIDREGAFGSFVPDRSANKKEYNWGIHLNVLKLLESEPCSNCLTLSNIHKLPDGDISVDISITHPYPNHLEFTGFDVRGIIMFPASQLFPDNDLRQAAGYDPWIPWFVRIANHEKGDAELMNPDGWTTIWGEWEDPNSEPYAAFHKLTEGDFPILKYYPGKYATGENLSMISAFKRYYSDETRYMFEPGKTVTRTYIIRPPSTGPIQASYAIYAHWAPATVSPVTNPELDFPPEANAPMPYEFWITQDEVLDPDMPMIERASHIHFHIKTWHIKYDKYWLVGACDIAFVNNVGGGIWPHPSREPDDYWQWPWFPEPYVYIPGYLPGLCTYLYRCEVYHPDNQGPPRLGSDYYIVKFEID
ncbi:MAG TPA: hypothetical protein ENN67_03940, partial [Firmicutes bacterium]|nr:hypothetical protein [Bacillota bacterium]